MLTTAMGLPATAEEVVFLQPCYELVCLYAASLVATLWPSLGKGRGVVGASYTGCQQYCERGCVWAAMSGWAVVGKEH